MMNLDSAKELMRLKRRLIKDFKEQRKEISNKIHQKEQEILDIKARIYRGEIK